MRAGRAFVLDMLAMLAATVKITDGKRKVGNRFSLFHIYEEERH